MNIILYFHIITSVTVYLQYNKELFNFMRKRVNQELQRITSIFINFSQTMLKLILIWLQDERLKMFGGCSKSYCLHLSFLWNSYIVLIFEHRFLMLPVNLIVAFLGRVSTIYVLYFVYLIQLSI